jgi:hypothetical protein
VNNLVLENKLEIRRSTTALTVALILLLTISGMISTTAAANSAPDRKTRAFLSVAPTTIGIDQQLTVNAIIYPSPASPEYSWMSESFKGVTVTFTRPDGTTDSFMPTDASGGLGAGETEMIGAIWFYYKPDQVGTWSVTFSFPGQTFTEPNSTVTVYYTPCTSPATTFTVQKDPVNAGVLTGGTPVALPTGYWTLPINSDNREWYQIAGDWLQPRYDAACSSFNPYTKAPNTSHILWTYQTSMGGIVGGDWGSISYQSFQGPYVGGGGSPTIVMNGKVYMNMPGNTFQCVDLRTGELLYTASGALSIGQHVRAATVLYDAARHTYETQAADMQPFLWEFGAAQWKRYDPLNGALLQTITNVPNTRSRKHTPACYVRLLHHINV